MHRLASSLSWINLLRVFQLNDIRLVQSLRNRVRILAELQPWTLAFVLDQTRRKLDFRVFCSVVSHSCCWFSWPFLLTHLCICWVFHDLQGSCRWSVPKGLVGSLRDVSGTIDFYQIAATPSSCCLPISNLVWSKKVYDPWSSGVGELDAADEDHPFSATRQPRGFGIFPASELAVQGGCLTAATKLKRVKCITCCACANCELQPHTRLQELIRGSSTAGIPLIGRWIDDQLIISSLVHMWTYISVGTSGTLSIGICVPCYNLFSFNGYIAEVAWSLCSLCDVW